MPVHGGTDTVTPLTPAVVAAVLTEVVNDEDMTVDCTVDTALDGTVYVTANANVVVGVAGVPVAPPTVIAAAAAVFTELAVARFVVETSYVTTLLNRRRRAAVCEKLIMSDALTLNELAAAVLNAFSSTAAANVCFAEILYVMATSLAVASNPSLPSMPDVSESISFCSSVVSMAPVMPAKSIFTSIETCLVHTPSTSEYSSSQSHWLFPSSMSSPASFCEFAPQATHAPSLT
mmetsp:Transcript_1088/g.3406  ORF Transcript_1088/g.3406 Transcript_1088/m.3406 type:complete len:233 (+) Transcript_1088:2086-2784(+)